MTEYERWKKLVGYTDAKVAKAIGVQPATISRWRAGITPSLKHAVAMEDLSKGAVPVRSWLDDDTDLEEL